MSEKASNVTGEIYARLTTLEAQLAATTLERDKNLRWREEAIANASKIAAERDAAKQSSLEWGQRYNESAEEREQWQRQAFEMQNERDAAQRDCAAMREALIEADAYASTVPCGTWIDHKTVLLHQIRESLSSTAGRNYVRREVLEQCADALSKCRVSVGVNCACVEWEVRDAALAAAQKELA